MLQDVTLIDATIFENIAFGTELKDIDFEHAIHCGRVAMIDESFFFEYGSEVYR